MSRDDDALTVKVPHFVHQELQSLVRDLGGEGNKTRLVAALIHAADLDTARTALRSYSDELARRARRRR